MDSVEAQGAAVNFNLGSFLLNAYDISRNVVGEMARWNVGII